VRSGSGWMEAIGNMKHEEETKHAESVIFNCRKDIEELWASPIVQNILRDEGVVLQDHAGLYVNYNPFYDCLLTIGIASCLMLDVLPDQVTNLRQVGREECLYSVP
jgi:hypothetical protein